MSDTAAVTGQAGTGDAASAAPSLGDIKATFAASLGRDVDGEEAAPEGKPRAADGKFAKGKPEAEPKAKPEPEPEAKQADEEDPDREPTNAERARFRAERRAVKQRQAEVERRDAEQRAMFATERQLWARAHSAIRDGKPMDALAALGIDPDTLVKQLTEAAVGNDPATVALQRRLAEMEAQQERQRLDAEERQQGVRIAQQQRAWEGEVAEALTASGDESLAAIAGDPELVAEVRKIQEQWFLDGDERQRTPKAMQRAARELAKRLETAHNRLGRIFRKNVEDTATETDAAKSSAAGRLQSPSEKRSTRSLGASQGSAKPVTAPRFDLSSDSGKRDWKRHYSELLKNSD